MDRDVLGRITAKRPAGLAAQNITYTYDTALIAGSYATGRLSRITDASGTTTFAYDHRGNLITKTQVTTNLTFATAFAYDLADRTVQITYPSGRIVSYVRDGRGRVTSVSTKANATATAVTLASGMTYEAFGPLKSLNFGNTLKLTQDWGNDDRLYAKTLKTSANANVWAKAYAYDNDDNITGITDLVTSGNSASYTYDPLSRLTQAVGNFGTIKREDYAYSPNGNRLTLEQRTSASSATPSLGASTTLQAGTNRLASLSFLGGTSRTFGYDGRGNITSEARPSAVAVANSYDAYGRLTGSTQTGATSWSMKYNGRDERVEATQGTTRRRFVYSEGGLQLGEYGTSATNIRAEHIWQDPDSSYEPLAYVAGTTIRYIHADHLGTPVLVTSTAGAVQNRYTHFPFGERSSTASSPTTLLAFPGQLIDNADRYYNMRRDYDPSLGRYLQADPIGLAGGGNVYGYLEGNPLNAFDPEGLEKVNLFGPGAGSFHDGVRRERDIPGVCLVYGHMSPQVIEAWRNGKKMILRTPDEIHRELMRRGCKPKQPVYFLGCRAGQGENSIAKRYAREFQVPTVGATRQTWWSQNGFGGIYGKTKTGGKDLSDPGRWEAFLP